MVSETRATFQAIDDFQRARRRAAIEQIMARIAGRSADLLSYEEVRRALKLESQIDRGLQSIPLDAIVGSVGRYRDFTRSFFPRSDQLADRWARVQTIATTDQGWPPIEVYQIGNTYFVRDGNHRVSVAREMGLEYIQAYVTEVRTKVPITPDATPDDLICKAEYADFLLKTGLKEQRPGLDLTVSVPGAYQTLLEHIAVHRHFMGLEQEHFIPFEEAAAHWYDNVYQPNVEIIEAKGLPRDFPDRTSTDLYLWLSEHRAELQDALGWEVNPGAAADHLAQEHSPTPERRLGRVAGKVLDRLVPNELEARHEPGEWRRTRVNNRDDDRLFLDLLVPVNGEDSGWRALDQAIVIARREDSEIRGLHIVKGESEKQAEEAARTKETFDQRCQEAGVQGHLVLETGPIASRICDRARWNDLVVLSLLHPPGKGILQRLGSGFRHILQNCPRPILSVPEAAAPFHRALLAYDGGRKSDEALFVAVYLSIRWDIPLVVLTVEKNEGDSTAVSERAAAYLAEKNIRSSIITARSAAPAETILATAEDHKCDFILMGGYGTPPPVELVLGSTTDEVLRRSRLPVLICQ